MRTVTRETRIGGTANTSDATAAHTPTDEPTTSATSETSSPTMATTTSRFIGRASIVSALVLLDRLLGLDHGYWVPLTTLAVLQPDEHASGVRAVQRAAGTLVGTALIALIAIATGEEWVMVAGQGIAAFALFALFARGYFWLVVLLTPTALLTVSAVDYQGVAVALQRAGWSALGILLGLAVAELCWRLAPHVPRADRGAAGRATS